MQSKDFESHFHYQKTDDEKALPPPKLLLKFDPTAVKVIHYTEVKTITEELANKYKKTEDVTPESAIESFGNPKSKKDSRVNKIQCKRCEHWFHHDDIDSHMNSHSSEILEWLYLGGYRNSTNYKELTVRTQINYILNVSIECENSFPGEFVYKKYDLEDTPEQDISAHFEEACEFLEQARVNSKRALVHCIQGMSRSASFVIAYLMLKQGMTLREAYFFVLSKRSIIRPNPGFLMQLIKLEIKHRGSSTMCETQIYSLITQVKKSEDEGSDGSDFQSEIALN